MDRNPPVHTQTFPSLTAERAMSLRDRQRPFIGTVRGMAIT